MGLKILLIFFCLTLAVSAWTLTILPVPRGPPRIARFIHPPPRPQIIRPVRPPQDSLEDVTQDAPRLKRNHEDFEPDRNTHGMAGPVHTFVKTDKNANYKWGVRHHVGNKYASEH